MPVFLSLFKINIFARLDGRIRNLVEARESRFLKCIENIIGDQRGVVMREVIEVIYFSAFVALGIIFIVLTVKAFCTNLDRIGPALKDSINRFS